MIWTNGSDLQRFNGKFAHSSLVREVPYMYLVDGEHCIVAKGLCGKELRQKIGDLLKREKKK